MNSTRSKYCVIVSPQNENMNFYLLTVRMKYSYFFISTSYLSYLKGTNGTTFFYHLKTDTGIYLLTKKCKNLHFY